jgi:tRNA1Val (adenine37-N6)-methyltransferase
MKKNDLFRFKKFEISHRDNGQKVSTDSVLLGAWADLNHAKKILDIGTGCGILALMATQRNVNASVTAIEKNEIFIVEAQRNFNASLFGNRIKGLHVNMNDFKGKFDFILCNPPYFINSLVSPVKERNEARHSEDFDISVLFQKAVELLDENGILSVVFPFNCFSLAVDEATKNNFKLIRICEIKHSQNSKAPSLILAEFSQSIYEFKNENLAIKNGDHYSQQYADLLQDFLTIF